MGLHFVDQALIELEPSPNDPHHLQLTDLQDRHLDRARRVSTAVGPDRALFPPVDDGDHQAVDGVGPNCGDALAGRE